MKRTLNQKAFTLIELIVCLVLLTIIALGIYAINMVLVFNDQDSGQQYSIKSQTQITLDNILNNASLGYGSANLNDDAILIGVPQQGGGNDPNSFCIRQPSSQLNGYSWYCYSWTNKKNSAYQYQINSCTETYEYKNMTTNPRGAGSCLKPSPVKTQILSGPTFVGTAFSMSPSFNANPQGASWQFSMKIQNCLDDSNTSTCFGTTQDPNNPEVTLTGSVIPEEASSS